MKVKELKFQTQKGGQDTAIDTLSNRSAGAGAGVGGEEGNVQAMVSEKEARQKVRVCALVILLLTISGCTAFLVYGISKARQDADNNFERRALELVKLIESTWKEYENACLSIHNYCRRSRNTTRKEFREFYEYLLASGLQFESAQCSPNVTLAERAAYEAEAREFYRDNYPSIDYQGIIGFVPDPDTGDLAVVPSPDLPFYFPVHYLEPVIPNAPAIELDMYSFPSQKNEIDLAVQSRQPVLSKRLHVVQETEEFAYSVIIYHPGIFLETEPDEYPTELSLILVRIPSLLSRVALVQEENLAVYLYDTTILNTGGKEEFLGAGAFIVTDDLTSGGATHELELINEVDYTSFHKQHQSSRLYEKEVAITPSGTWKVVVVPIDGTFDPHVTFVCFGGAMIVMAGLFIVIWYLTNVKRDARMNKMRVAAEAERAALIVKNAEEAAQTERELNDFLAHEVRNPLAAAISATSFVSSAVHENKPLSNETVVKSVRENTGVINSSLQYVNDLLRNMLDMHKAASGQLHITLTQVNLREDILEPVATILYRRENGFTVEMDCPQNLTVRTDIIRLKQIVLNLASNSCKFVSRGFIRLGARVAEDGNVLVFVEDSGPGIPMEKRHNLFEKFQTSLDALSQGTGFGLCLCKDLASLMNGELYLDDTFDSVIEGCPGARFVVDLKVPPLEIVEEKLDTDAENPPTVHVASALPELPNEFSVLFTDDDMALRKLFTRALKRVVPTWKISEAANGETCLRMVETEKYDVSPIVLCAIFYAFVSYHSP